MSDGSSRKRIDAELGLREICDFSTEFSALCIGCLRDLQQNTRFCGSLREWLSWPLQCELQPIREEMNTNDSKSSPWHQDVVAAEIRIPSYLRSKTHSNSVCHFLYFIHHCSHSATDNVAHASAFSVTDTDAPAKQETKILPMITSWPRKAYYYICYNCTN